MEIRRNVTKLKDTITKNDEDVCSGSFSGGHGETSAQFVSKKSFIETFVPLHSQSFGSSAKWYVTVPFFFKLFTIFSFRSFISFRLPQVHFKGFLSRCSWVSLELFCVGKSSALMVVMLLSLKSKCFKFIRSRNKEDSWLDFKVMPLSTIFSSLRKLSPFPKKLSPIVTECFDLRDLQYEKVLRFLQSFKRLLAKLWIHFSSLHS